MANSYTRRINLYINGKEVKNNIGSIQSEMRKLINEQKRMTIGSQEYNAHTAKIRSLRGIMKQHQQDIAGIQKSWSFKKMADGFNRYFGIITAAIASFAGFAVTIKSTVQAYAEFDDKLADVIKTTGLTKDQVKALNTELSKIDTRTSQLQLLDLARVAGKLGITAEEEILGFVRAADKINVALSEDLGGDAEQAINQLGKLVDIFDLKEPYGIEDALLKIGSAINSLGAAGTANEAYMVEFSKRIAGIAPSAGISITEVLGLAATLDELGQTSEVSGTAISQVIGKMFKDTETYARIARMELGAFTELMNTDANEAFIKVLEGAKGSGTGFSEMAKNLQGLGLDGARSTAVLSVLANNIDKLREKQQFSNEEFDKGTSILDEFNTKNTTAQAELEKAKKRFQEISVELGERLSPAYTGMIKKGSVLIKTLGILVEFLYNHGRQLVVITSAIVGYTVATKVAVMWQNRNNAATLASIVAQKLQALAFNAQFAAIALYNTAVALLSGRMKVAAIQFRAFSAALAANPIGIVAGAIIALGTALYFYSKRMTDAEKVQRAMNKINMEAEKAIVEERLEVERLVRIAKDELRSKKDRIDALNELKRIAPEYYKGISIETINTDKATKATQDYITALREKARAQAAQERLVEIEKELIEIENKSDMSFWDKARANGLAYAAGLNVIYSDERLLRKEDELRTKQAAELNLQKEKLLKITSQQAAKNKQLVPGINNESGVTSEPLKQTDYKTALAALDAANQERMDRLVIQYEQEAWTDQQYKAQQLVAEMAYLETKKALQQQYGENTLGTEAALSKKRVEAQKEINELLAEGDKELFDEIAADSKVVDEAAQATIDTADAAIKSLENSATKEQQIMQQREQTYLQFAQMVGQSFGELLADSEATFGDYLKNTLLMALEAFHQWFIIEKAKAIIEGISGGPFKIAAAIAKVAAMEIAYQGVKAVVTSSMGSKKKPKGYAAGGFTDGDRIYRAGEVGEEWIAPNSLVRHPVFGPVIQMLDDFRTRPNQVNQLAIAATQPSRSSMSSLPSGLGAGQTGTNLTQPYTPTSDPELKALLGKLTEQLDGGIQAWVPKWGDNGLYKGMKDIERFNKKIGRK